MIRACSANGAAIVGTDYFDMVADAAVNADSAILSRIKTPASAAKPAPQSTKAISTTHRGATPTRLSKNGRKFHVVMCT